MNSVDQQVTGEKVLDALPEPLRGMLRSGQQEAVASGPLAPVFEVLAPNGQVFKIWANGLIEGFPQGSAVSNGLLPLLNYARGLLVEPIKRGIVTEQDAARLDVTGLVSTLKSERVCD